MNISAIRSQAEQGTSTALNTLGPDDFLQLLIAQLKTQDPLSPMDTQSMVTQLSTMQMVTENRAVRQSQEMLQAVGLMGREITWQDELTGNLNIGQVSGVLREGSEARLIVGDVRLKLGQIMTIL